MSEMLPLLLVVSCFQLAAFTDPTCVIELECAECMPEHPPLVTSHGAQAGAVRVPSGDEAALRCGAGKFLLYPLLDTLTVVCEGGQFRVRHDGSLRHLLELGCQESVFEDVLHQVEHCGAPLQGRAYQMRDSSQTRHLATLCYDEDRALTRCARVTNAPRNALRVPPHGERAAPLSLLGNFNHMFDAKTRADADRLYSDEARLARRLREMFKHDRVTFAGQTLAAAKLLSPHYFEDQNMHVTDFASNKLAVWRSVAEGNLRHLQQDVAALLSTRARAPLDVYTGTHGVMSLRVPQGRKEVFLKPGRFPVPKYVWAVVHDRQTERALAVAVLNDPFVAVSEVRAPAGCASCAASAATRARCTGWPSAARCTTSRRSWASCRAPRSAGCAPAPAACCSTTTLSSNV